MKNHKKLTTIVSNYCLLLLVALAFGASDTFAQAPKKTVDISCRPALYFGENILSDQPLNSKSRYVTAGGKIVLTPKDAIPGNKNGYSSFFLLYILYGSPAKEVGALGEFTNRLRIGSQTITQNTIKFWDTDGGVLDTKIRYVRTTITLPIGTSVVTLSLDDDKKVVEGNENNNLYTFMVEVLAK